MIIWFKTWIQLLLTKAFWWKICGKYGANWWNSTLSLLQLKLWISVDENLQRKILFNNIKSTDSHHTNWLTKNKAYANIKQTALANPGIFNSWLMSHVCSKCGRPTLKKEVDVTPKEKSQLVESAQIFILLILCECGWHKIYPKW